jgi:two-component system, sensor histidine kinase and response regulator
VHTFCDIFSQSKKVAIKVVSDDEKRIEYPPYQFVIMKERILVIEDDISLREFMIKYFLEKQGYTVITAENGEIGLEKAKAELPDLIICDIMMPKMNGYEVIQELHKNPQTKNIPFIFLTAMNGHKDMREGMVLGADDFSKRLEKSRFVNDYAQQTFNSWKIKIANVLPHEFRTPLSTILSASNIMINDSGMPAEEVKEMAGYINASAKRLNRLVENYLLFVSLELITDSSDLRNDQMVCDKFFIQERVLPQAKHHGREQLVIFEASMDSLRASIAISEAYLNKILEEVIDNACKFSPKSSEITITTQVTNDKFILSVTNVGKGLSREQVQEIGAFMQFNREVDEQQGGGLGLALTKKILELHGGLLSFDSVPNEQITVHCTIPLSTKTS